MATSSRHSSRSPPPIIVSRKRASTKVLLGPAYQEIVTESIPAPKPGKTIEDYDTQKLKVGLQYADSTLRADRQLSPLGMRAVLIYKEAVSTLLSMQENEDLGHNEEDAAVKEEWLAIVRMHEQSAMYSSCLRVTHSSEAQEFQDEIAKLQRTSFFARYGDVFATTCQNLRLKAEKMKAPGWQALIGRYWSEINKTIIHERPAWTKFLHGGKEFEDCRTHILISDLCRSVGFDLDDMLAVINLYATRNEIVHADLALLIKQGKFDDLKKRLYDDFCDVPRVVPATDTSTTRILSYLIEDMIDRWFIRGEESPDNVQMWGKTDRLLDDYRKLNGGGIIADVYKEMSTAIASAEDNKAKELSKDLEDGFGLSLGKKKVKRVASADLSPEGKKVKVMQKDWTRLNNMAYGIRKLSETYVEKYGELEEPPEIRQDPNLD
ncbi:hypothetical protein MMC17_010233 [Xylographa soralifera]|nr:hypothetical protein [Xylographa soralifera]